MDPKMNTEFVDFRFDSPAPESSQRDDDNQKHLNTLRSYAKARSDTESAPTHEYHSSGPRNGSEKALASSTGSASEKLAADEIVWHYLTYETQLPNPTRGKLHEQNTTPPPEAPDLGPYQNPLEWSGGHKSVLVWISSVATGITAYCAGCYAPGIDQMSAEWNISTVAASAGITSFTAGFAIAPMVLAPLSELNGRRPIFLITGVLFLIADLCCALTRIYPGMVIGRFLAGCSSSTFSTMVGGVVSDIYVASERNTPMTLYTGGVFFGTGLGPLVSSFIAQHTTWRWIFFVHAIMVGILVVVLVLFFSESRGSVLLSKKAKKLNAWYEAREQAGYYGFDMIAQGSNDAQSQRVRWQVKADEERATIRKMIAISVVRPFHLLFTEPVVFFFSLWITFAWSILFCTFNVIPFVFETVYDFSLQESGAVFAAISISSILATILSIYQEKVAAHFGKLSSAPEGRLMFAAVESALLPIALFWFGWTASPSIPWIVPTLAIGCASFGIFSVYLAVFNYLADTYHLYASSAIAAQSFCRNLVAGCFPLFSAQIFSSLGFGPAGSLLGGIGIVLTLVPWVLMLFGPRIRARSKFAAGIVANK